MTVTAANYYNPFVQQELELIVEAESALPAGSRPWVTRLAAAGLAGSCVTFAYAALKLAYYWPVVQSTLGVQFTCVG